MKLQTVAVEEDTAMHSAAPSTMAHVLVLPYPSQGHINPMLQFAKRLAAKGPRATLVTTLFIINSIDGAATGPVRLAAITDGHDEGGASSAASLEAYLHRLQDVGARSLGEVIQEHDKSNRPFTCMVYDTYMPWAIGVAERLGLARVAYSTQSCAVSAIYYFASGGTLDVPREVTGCTAPWLPPMERSDFPSLAFKDGSYPTLAALALSQYNDLEKADSWILFNSFDELENEAISCLRKQWQARTIGPCVPTKLTDKQDGGCANSYGMNLLQEDDTCLQWLAEKPAKSVVYASFGSFASLPVEQMEELAYALKESCMDFLWVVRASEQDHLPADFLAGLEPGAGLVVQWSPQMDVLTHEAVGCFLTHCGWNSTLEALTTGVPMVAMAQWTDQPTNAKYVEDVWGVGLRAKGGERNLITRDEIRRCIKEVMHGKRSEEIRRNAKKWSELAKKALREGGSSDENLNEFLEYVNAKTEERLNLKCDDMKKGASNLSNGKEATECVGLGS